MPEDPGIQLLLESILSAQREAFTEMRRLTSTMATKDDIANLTSEMEDTIARREYDEYRVAASERIEKLEERVKTLENDRPPKWLWPMLAACASLVCPVITAIVTHWITTRPHG